MKRALFLLALFGCSSSEPTSAPATAQASAASSAPQRQDGAEKSARELLARWLAAQNGGDFSAYGDLYATKFEGVKRAGPRTRRFGREGWLADRKPMFEKKMKVEASDVKVVASAGSVRLRFVQRFASGTFQDEGPKEIVVVKDGSGWKIAREEMLRSTLQKLEPIAGENFAFVVRGGVVLSTTPDSSWMRGAPRLLEEGDPVTTEADVHESRLPQAMQAWRDRPVRVFGEGGEVCQATVTGFSLLARVVPHFGTRAMWRGKPEEAGIILDGPPDPPLSKAELAAAAFNMAAGGQLLIGKLKPQSGNCGKALWARGAALPVPKAAAAVAPPAALQQRALDAFRNLPAYKVIADDHRKQGGAGHWDEHDGARPEVQQFRGDRTYVAVDAEAGIGCGDFAGSLLAIFELQGDRLVLVNDPTDGPMPSSAVDVDGDGNVEFIADESIRRAKGASFDHFEALEVPFLDCGC